MGKKKADKKAKTEAPKTEAKVEESAQPKVGFIGVGLMGHGMAKNILEKGYPLTILGHKNRKPVTDLVKRGAVEAKSPKALAEACDVVFLCVTGTPQVEDLVQRADGLKAGAHKGLIIVDCSTSIPQSTLALAAELKPLGVRFIDVPLGRTPRDAEAGKLNAMVGCDKKTLKEIRPILEAWAENIIHVGGVGDGHKIKLINNFVAMGYASLYAEALTTAAKSGLKLESLASVLSAGPLACGIMENIIKKGVLGGDPEAHMFTLKNCLKDISYYAQFAAATPSSAVVGNAVQQAYVIANSRGHGREYMPQLCHAVAKLNDTKLG